MVVTSRSIPPHVSFPHNKNVELKSTWRLPVSDSPAVTHLAWSQWVECPPSQRSKNWFVSILAASRNDGSVHLSQVTLDPSEQDGIAIFKVQTNASYNALPKNRLAITRLAWTRRQNALLLAVCVNGFLVIAVHRLDNLDAQSTSMVMCRHGNYSPVIGKSEDH